MHSTTSQSDPDTQSNAPTPALTVAKLGNNLWRIRPEAVADYEQRQEQAAKG